MQVTESNIEGLCHEYKIKVDAQDLEDRMTARLGELSHTARLPGFRPGRVPMSLLRKRYGKSLLGEVLEETVNTSTQSAIADRSLRLAMQPKIEINNFEEGKDLEFTLNVELLPEIEKVDYSSIKIERYVSTPTKTDIDDALKRLADAQKSYVDAPEKHEAKNGDVLALDFVGTIDEEEFEGGKSEGARLELGSNQFIPGFEDQLIGAKAGAELDITCTFPADYGVKNLAGRVAVFHTKIKSIQISEKVEINEKLAERLGLQNLDEVRNAVSEQLDKDYKIISRRRLKRALLDELALLHDFTVPPGMVNAEFETIWKAVEEAKKRGESDPDDEKKSEEELRNQYTDIATRRVRLGLLLTELGRRNNIESSQEELNQAVQEYAMRYPGQEQEVFNHLRNNPNESERLRGPIIEDKVVDFLFEIISITDRKVDQAELMDEAETPIGSDSQNNRNKVATKKKKSSVSKGSKRTKK